MSKISIGVIPLWKKLLSFPMALILSAFVGYMALVLVYCIPTGGAMHKHLINSAAQFKEEGTYPRLMARGDSHLDNFTDALMLLAAGHPKVHGSIKDALNIGIKGLDKCTPNEVLVKMSNDERVKIHTWNYGRYWHGYLVFLKPLLYLTDYQGIRGILAYGQMIVFVYVIWLLTKIKKLFVVPVLMTYLYLNPVATMLSLQYNSMTMLMFLGVIGCIKLSQKKTSDYLWCVYYMFVGVLASYLDLLTFPIITLGIPLLLLISFRNNSSVWENLKSVLMYSAAWTFGYGGFWALKWVLGTIITGTNFIQNAFSAVVFRTSSTWAGHKFTLIRIVGDRFICVEGVYYLALLIMIGYFLWNLRRRFKVMSNVLVPICVVMTYPVVWYAVLRNHSGIHSFTYRVLSIIICGVLTYLAVVKEQSDNE